MMMLPQAEKEQNAAFIVRAHGVISFMYDANFDVSSVMSEFW
jgi:hypothetical protein